MNKEIAKEIIQINNNIAKEEIAFIIYTNVEENNEDKLFSSIADLICRWVTKEDNIKLYVTDYENDILKIDDNNTNTKVVYILNNNYEEKLNYNKNTKYINVYSTDEIVGVDNTYINIYSCFEKKINDDAIFKPYSSEVYDYNDAEEFEIEEELFTNIEEIYAKESYKKHIILGLYRLINNELCSYEGYEYSIIKNDINTNSNIIEVINDTFDTKIKYEDINNLKKDNLKDAINEIYLNNSLCLEDDSVNKLSKLTSELESRLGNYKNAYLIIEGEEEETIVNSFFVNMSTYCIVFEKTLLIISYGSNE